MLRIEKWCVLSHRGILTIENNGADTNKNSIPVTISPNRRGATSGFSILAYPKRTAITATPTPSCLANDARSAFGLHTAKNRRYPMLIPIPRKLTIPIALSLRSNPCCMNRIDLESEKNVFSRQQKVEDNTECILQVIFKANAVNLPTVLSVKPARQSNRACYLS